jgi:hypothetical protein
MAAQNNFRDCLTKSNVQLAVAHATKAADTRQQDKKYDNVEGKRALTAKSRIPQVSKTPPKREPVPPPPKALDTGQPYMGKLCSNCRGKHPTDVCTTLPCFICLEYDEPHIHTQADCPYRARVKATKAKVARRRAREIQFLARHDDSDDTFYTDDFSDTWFFYFFPHTHCMLFFCFHSKKGGLRYKLARQFSIVTYFSFVSFYFRYKFTTRSYTFTE